MKNLKLNLSILFSIVSTLVFAQQNDDQQQLSLDSGSIDNQFEYVIKKSNNYQQYEVIEKVWMNKLRKNVNDTLAKSKTTETQLLTQISTQQSEISGLKSQLASTNDNLTQTTREKESISFFGNLVKKGIYKSIMWSIVGVLTVLLLTFIYKFRNSNIVTQEARASLSDLEEEFEQHRRRALEREQKLSRQLQDELNKKKLMKK